MPEFEYRVPVCEAIEWDLVDGNLQAALVDEAELAGAKKYGQGFYATEVNTKITTDATDFIVTMTWSEDDVPPAVTRVRVSFDVTTRRAGIAILEVPAGADVQAILNDYLDKHGNELVTELLPEDIKVIEWDLESPGESTIDTDYVEPHEEEATPDA